MGLLRRHVLQYTEAAIQIPLIEITHLREIVAESSSHCQATMRERNKVLVGLKDWTTGSVAIGGCQVRSRRLRG
jgi:hypothetical protein